MVNPYVMTIAIIIGIIIYYWTTIKAAILEKIEMDFERNRINPLFMPFVGLSEKAPGKNYIDKVIKNFNFVTDTIVVKSIENALRPLTSLMEGIYAGISSITNLLDVFRNMGAVMRNLFKTVVEGVIEKIQNSRDGLTYLIEKLKLMIQKQSAMFSLLMEYSGAMRNIMSSMTNNHAISFVKFFPVILVALIIKIIACLTCGMPIIGVFSCIICRACFVPETPILIEKGGKKIEKRLDEVEIGDELENGNRVEGVIRFYVNNETIYNYQGVWVSGSHMVFEKNRNEWIRIEDSENIIEKKIYSGMLVCLLTSKQEMPIQGITFSDYAESGDEKLYSRIKQAYLSSLNGVEIKENELADGYKWGGFTDRVIINGKSIKDYRIGEQIGENNYVFGVIEYEYKNSIYCNDEGIQTTPHQIYRKHGYGKYRFINENCDDENNQTPVKMYHLMTTKGYIEIDKYEFRDFFDSLDDDVNMYVEEILLKGRNNRED